jgi:hypothetical protein
MSSVTAAAVAGALLGVVGSVIQAYEYVAIAGFVGLIAVGASLTHIVRHRPQRDRETPRLWIQGGHLTWAIRNGFTLGIGARSRIGFWLWYCVPVAALCSSSPTLGAAIYATYGASRSASVWGILGIWKRARGRPIPLLLVQASSRLRAAADVQLAALSILAIATKWPG